MDMGTKIIIPWGMWELGTGRWTHNPVLRMTKNKQYESNMKNGFSCRHKCTPPQCLICGKIDA